MLVLETEFVERALHNSLFVHGLNTFGAQSMTTSQRQWPFPAEVVRVVANAALVLVLLSLSVLLESLLVLFLDYLSFHL